MPTVQLAVCGMQRNIDIVWPLTGGIAAAFAPFGITLVPQLGRVLNQDPYGTSGGWDALLRQLYADSNNQTLAYLVATDTAPEDDPTINGMLYDAQTRGVCAVFLGAQIYLPQGPANRSDLVTEVCVHELGHLLNLTHGDGALAGYPNAMLPASQRKTQPPVQAWREAVRDAASRGEPAVAIPSPVLTYPFSAQCRANLREATVDDTWLPYQTAFRGDGQGADSVDDRSLALSVLPHDEAPTHVGGGLYFTVKIENRGEGPVELPLHLTPEHGALRIVVHHEDGRSVVHRPCGILCSDARLTLNPGQDWFESIAIIGRTPEALIAAPGRHRCRVELLDDHAPGRAMLGAAEFEFIADEEPAKAALSRRLVRLLAPGSRPPGAMPDLEGVDERSALVSHLRLASAFRRRPGPRQREQLEACLSHDTPRALRHRAARRLAVQQLRRGADPVGVESALAEQFSEPADQTLILALRRSAEGYARQRGRTR